MKNLKHYVFNVFALALLVLAVSCGGGNATTDTTDIKTLQLSACLDGDGDGFFIENENFDADSQDEDAESNAEDCDGLDSDGEDDPTEVDCDDTDADVNSDADEIEDGIDNDCDGDIDANITEPEVDCTVGLEVTLYADSDDDGFGDADNEHTFTIDQDMVDNNCEEGTADSVNYVLDDTDCDDSEAAVNPDATEVADDGIDNDCDGTDDTTEPEPDATEYLSSVKIEYYTDYTGTDTTEDISANYAVTYTFDEEGAAAWSIYNKNDHWLTKLVTNNENGFEMLTTRTYDSSGRVLTEEQDNGNDGSTESSFTYTYTEGTGTLTIVATYTLNGTLEETTTKVQTLDEYGSITLETIDYASTAGTDSTTQYFYEYDSVTSGQINVKYIDYHGDASDSTTADVAITYGYDSNNMTSQTYDTGNSYIWSYNSDTGLLDSYETTVAGSTTSIAYTYETDGEISTETGTVGSVIDYYAVYSAHEYTEISVVVE